MEVRINHQILRLKIMASLKNKESDDASGIHIKKSISLPALAIGAVALGALAIGALAIGRLAIGKASIRRLEIDQLVVRDLKILNRTRFEQTTKSQ